MVSEYFPPKELIIPHDDYHGKLVGKTQTGDQFFITTPFTWQSQEGGAGVEFVALYLFDDEGQLKNADIEKLGLRSALVGEEAAKILPGNVAQKNTVSQKVIDKHIQVLGDISYEDITVNLFTLEKFGIKFGLFPDEGLDLEEGESPIYVRLEPGDYMAFYPPWDGEYDT